MAIEETASAACPKPALISVVVEHVLVYDRILCAIRISKIRMKNYLANLLAEN